MAESFFASLECELLDRRCFHTHAEAKLAVFEWIEGWYNTRRRHSSLGYLSPVQFERDLRAGRISTAELLPRSAADRTAVESVIITKENPHTSTALRH